MKNKIKVCILTLLLPLSLAIYVRAENSSGPVSAEIMKITAEDKQVFIYVARRYPEITFTQMPGMILINCPNTKYHKLFKYAEEEKENLLSNLDFVNDLSVAILESNSGSDSQNVQISLDIMPGLQISPKVVSTKNNIIKISFVEPEINIENFAKKSVDSGVISLYNKAVEEHGEENLEAAEALYNQVILKDNKFYIAKFNLAKLYIDKKSYDESCTLLLSLLEDFKKLPQNTLDEELLVHVHNTLGSVYFLKNKLYESEQHFRKALKINNKFYQSHYNIALIYEKLKDLTQAKSNLSEVIKLKPDFIEAYYHLAIVDLILKNKNDAVMSFKKVIESAPGTLIAKLSEKELEKLE